MFLLDIFRSNSSQQVVLSAVAEMSPLAVPLDEILLDVTIPPPTEFQDFGNEAEVPKTPEHCQDTNNGIVIPDLPEDDQSQFRPSMSSLTPDLLLPAERNVLKTVATSTPRNTQNSLVNITFFTRSS